MNELIVIFVIIVTLAVGYLWVYPKVAGTMCAGWPGLMWH